eukprot:9331826-Karenia_brevis.AAC.1
MPESWLGDSQAAVRYCETEEIGPSNSLAEDAEAPESFGCRRLDWRRLTHQSPHSHRRPHSHRTQRPSAAHKR